MFRFTDVNKELAMETVKWSKPYYGISHLGAISDFRRATVDDRVDFVILSKWWKGCGFSPEKQVCNTVDEAKLIGEAWITNGNITN